MKFLRRMILIVMVVISCTGYIVRAEWNDWACIAANGIVSTEYALTVGRTVPLSLQLRYDAAAEGVTWKSSNRKIASVRQGVVKGLKPGVVTISATFHGSVYTCKVTVKHMALDSKSITCPVGKKQTITSGRKAVKASWKSSNKKVAAVTKQGVIKGISPGKATISAKINGKKYKVTVKVAKKGLYRVDEPSNIYIAPGEKYQITSYGSKFKADWEVGDSSIADISKSGVITGKKEGWTYGEVIVNNQVHQVSVYVKKPAPVLVWGSSSKGSELPSSFDWFYTYTTTIENNVRKTTQKLNTSGSYGWSVGSYDNLNYLRMVYNPKEANVYIPVASWKSSDPSVMKIWQVDDRTAAFTVLKSGAATITVTAENGKAYKFRFNTSNTAETIAQMRQTVYRQAGITRNMKPQYQLFLLAKWECEHVSYGEEVTSTTIQELADPFTVYKTGEAVCEGYSELYYLLVMGLGIELQRVIHLGDNHEWIQAKVDGEWYNIDVTWMDSETGVPNCGWFLTSNPSFPLYEGDQKTTSTRFEKCTWNEWLNGGWNQY